VRQVDLELPEMRWCKYQRCIYERNRQRNRQLAGQVLGMPHAEAAAAAAAQLLLPLPSKDAGME
jgi:hypothetical protein